MSLIGLLGDRRRSAASDLVDPVPCEGSRLRRLGPAAAGFVVAAVPCSWPSIAFDLPASLGVGPRPPFGDFDILMVAGATARRGALAPAYDPGWMAAAGPAVGVPAGKVMLYAYPPTAAFLLAPLSALPAPCARLVAQSLGLLLFATGLVAHVTALGLERRGASAGVVALACRDRRWLTALALSLLSRFALIVTRFACLDP